MPDSFDWFFENNSIDNTIVSYSIKPDQWKSSDPYEGYRHYYDFDIPHTEGEPSYGVLPWALEDNFNTFVQYLRDKNWDSAAQLAGVICHYTGDASMPLHATSDYWLDGAHSDYESEVYNHLYNGDISISSYVPHELENVFDAAMTMLEESYWFTDSTHTDNTKLSYWLAQGILWNDTIRDITENRLNAAVQFTANVWYTAMIRAGALSPIWPENGVYLFDNTPTFIWTSEIDPGGVTYQIQIDDNSDFGSPVYFAVGLVENTHTLPDENALALGTYFWRVRAKDGAGNVGNWSSVWTFFVCTQTSWAQTDWKGGPTKPALQVGTWDNIYDNFYDNENVGWNDVPGTMKLRPLDRSGSVNLNPTADSFVSQGYATSNYGTSDVLYIGYTSGYREMWTYLKFDLSSVPSDSTITSATLNLYVTSKSDWDTEAREVTDDTWTESGIIWNNKPAMETLLDTRTVNAANRWWSWNVTSFVNSQFQGGDSIVSLGVKHFGQPNKMIVAHSREGSNKPYLAVSYITPIICENGWFTSSVFDAGKTVDWKAISWGESRPSGTSIVVKARTGGDNDPRDGGWSGWYQHANGAENTLMPNNRYVQYRVELSTIDNTKTPELLDITINYAVGGKVSLTLNLRAGWNMVSFPVLPDNSDPDSMFSGYYKMYRWNAPSQSYVTSGGSSVEPDEPIVPGVGYWVNVLAGENVVVSGTPVDNLTLSLSTGWNLIGSPLGGASIANPDDTPDGSVLPSAFTWDGSRYVNTTDLVAGAGYWINARNSCELRL